MHNEDKLRIIRNYGCHYKFNTYCSTDKKTLKIRVQYKFSLKGTNSNRAVFAIDTYDEAVDILFDIARNKIYDTVIDIKWDKWIIDHGWYKV